MKKNNPPRESLSLLCKEALGEHLINAAEKGDIEMVRYLTTSEEVFKTKGFHADIQAQDNRAFRFACSKGHLEVVRFLLTAPAIRPYQPHADIHAREDAGLIWALNKGHLELAKFLLVSPQLHSHANLHAQDGMPLRVACANGHKEMVHFMLTDPQILVHHDSHANIYACKAQAFREACLYEKKEVIDYLVLEYGLKRNEDVNNIVAQYPEIEGLFQARELKMQLDTKLPVQKEKHKTKI